MTQDTIKTISISIEENGPTIKVVAVTAARSILFQFESNRPTWLHVWAKLLAYIIEERK